ncbi:hypothetical protein BBJ28_00010620 [Nothophytophthora sp. Chile5]|nr:hypothetical protein BBJ28_00010620 [Nothophytophthora sp. Chile5]
MRAEELAALEQKGDDAPLNEAEAAKDEPVELDEEEEEEEEEEESDDQEEKAEAKHEREKAEKSRRDGTGPRADDQVALPSLRASLEKVGSCEKNELLLHLLGQQEALRMQRSEVAALGEQIAAQLLSQQHELQQKYLEQINELEAQLHDATHFHPQVAALQTKVDELEESNREHEQKLRFAVRTSESSVMFEAEYG